jgi:arylsulfatase A-like enzyme
VLLICLDTVRADAFAPWTDDPLLPECSAWFAARGTAFRQAVSAAPWTAPAVASLLTGLLPSRHGARDLAADLTVVPSVVTLAELLGAQGWRRAAFAGGGWVSTRNGMLQGFEHAIEAFSFGAATPHLLRGFPAIGTDPWFVFAHTYEAHDPYLAPPAEPGRVPPPPPPVDLAAVDREAERDGGRALTRRFLLDARTRSVVFENALGGPRIQAVTRYLERGFRADPQGPALAAEARAAYDEGLRRLDRAVATFLREVEAAGLLKDAVVFLVSDHGEAFGEHGTLHHGRMLHDVLVRAPLLVAGPGFTKGAVVDEPCSLTDVVPTVCELAGLPAPEGIDGRSLLPLVRGGRGRNVVSE